tara:strand:- start:1607 stop:2062 length:456 start_codon:yes stop_codon:yes gene_type:complete
MNCYKASNNKFFNSVAKMSDGRTFTDYRPNNEINEHILSNNKVANMHNYRMFLSRNAKAIMEKNNEYMFLKNGLYNCKKPYEIGTMLPEQTRVVCDEHNCKRVLVNENGIGQGREYVTKGPNKLLDPILNQEIRDDNVCSNNNYNMFINTN